MGVVADDLHPQDLAEEVPRILPVVHSQRQVIEALVPPRPWLAAQGIGAEHKGRRAEVIHRFADEHVGVDRLAGRGAERDATSDSEALRQQVLERFVEDARPPNASLERPFIRQEF